MTDIEICYKAFRTPLIKDLQLTSSGFGMEVELTALITRTKAHIYEVPISYYGRTYEEGKKIKFSDGLAALWYIFYYNIVSRVSSRRREYIRQANSFLAQSREKAKKYLHLHRLLEYCPPPYNPDCKLVSVGRLQLRTIRRQGKERYEGW